MTRHRTTYSSLALLLTVALALAPGSALAGSLLSGYGAPGGGTQAILGSTLLHGGGGNGGGGRGSTTNSGAEGSPTGAVGNGSGATAPTGGSGGRGRGVGASGRGAGSAGSSDGSGAHGSGATRAAGGAGASVGGSSTYTFSGSSRLAGAGDYGPLGFTRVDDFLLLLVLGVLTLTAGLTRRLAGTQRYQSKRAPS